MREATLRETASPNQTTAKSLGKRGAALALLALPLATFYLLWSVSVEVRQETIQQWVAQQRTLANEVARGVEGFLRHYQDTAAYLAANENIIDLNERGRQLMDGFLALNRHSLRAVSRVDANGAIIYTTPLDPATIGRDVSDQEHNRLIMSKHEPVVSDVFQTLQGYPAVAFAVPVLREGQYKGSLTLLVAFEDIAATYLENIRLGRGEYAWVLTQQGKLIFRTDGGPAADHLSGRKSCKHLEALTTAMLRRERGTQSFVCPTAPGGVEQDQLAVFIPMHLANTFWSLAIAAPEREVLAVMHGLLVRWSLIIAVMLAAWLVLFYYTVRSWGVLAETRKRVAAEQALRASEEQLRLLFEYSLDGVMLTTPEGLILAANPAACRLLGYSEDELKNLPPAATLDPEDPRTGPARQERARTGQFRGEMTFIRKDGVRIEMGVASSLFQDSQGRAMATTIMRDLSERKKAEREKAQLEASLRRSQQMEALGTLAGGIAHDFNNILAAIMGYAELARQRFEPGQPVVGELKQVLRASERAKDLVRQILSFSRQGGQEKRPLMLGPIVKETLKLLRASLPPSIEVRSKLEPEAGAVLADATQMHQVLMNLCTNAVHAMANQEGILEVILARAEAGNGETAGREGLEPGAYLVLTVRDTGQGMDSQTLERIFEPYFSTKEQGRGTGLGLAVVHGIVKSHEGAIFVESQPGQGSSFEVWLPRHAESPNGAAGPSREQDLPRGQERILLVEDELKLAEAMSLTLESLGYRVRAVSDGQQALQALRAEPEGFDLLLTDLVLPGLGGGKLVEQARLVQPRLPVLVSTGYANEEEMARLRILGAAEVLLKPVGMEQLALAVRRALDGEGQAGG